LGFDPTTHRQLLSVWNNARVGQTQARSHMNDTVRQWDSRVSVWLRVAPKNQVPPAPQSIQHPHWDEVSVAWQRFWNAVKGIWLDLSVKLSRVRG
jgi:hypothetical protein